jgi:uncharacterized protein
MNNAIQKMICDYIVPFCKNIIAADVRIGLAYTSVRLDNGNTGIAFTYKSYTGSCTHEQKAGSLAGTPASELVNMLDTGNSLSRSIGLATANAVATGMPHPESRPENILDILDIKESEHVVMVGSFGPLLPRLKRIGCRLDIMELNNNIPGTISPEKGRPYLAECDVAIITATSILNGTVDELLSKIVKSRATVILGPSSFMRPEVFRETPVTHIAGVWVRDIKAVEKIVSEGGGTMILKPYMDFVTICVDH